MDDYLQTFEARGHEYNEATSFCPGAREAERHAVITRLDCQPGQAIVDAPAGGGYVADGLAAKMQGAAEIICVEPSKKFAAAIGERHRTLINSLERVELPDQSVDRIASLAGLHHLGDKRPVYREWARILKTAGRLVVADVSTETGTGDFLNGFVNEHTPGGHYGVFIAEGEFESQLSASGFDVHSESLETVPWRFPDLRSLGIFCKKLFNIEAASAAATASALADYVGVHINKDATAELRWQLRVATASQNNR